MQQAMGTVPAAAGDTEATTVDYPLFAGVGNFNPTTGESAVVIDVAADMSQPAFASGSVWGATYDPVGDRVLYTSPNGSAVGEGDVLWEWSPASEGGPTQIGTITHPSGDIRIDGLAMVSGTLYGWQQFDRPAGPPGLYEIDLSTLEATLVASSTSSDISGLDADPTTGTIYGLADLSTALVEIALDGTITTVASYPDSSESDLDGLAIGGGKAYLIPDDDSPGLIYVYDFASGTFDPPLTAPWTSSETFAAGAYITGPSTIFSDGFESGDTSAWSGTTP